MVPLETVDTQGFQSFVKPTFFNFFYSCLYLPALHLLILLFALLPLDAVLWIQCFLPAFTKLRGGPYVTTTIPFFS